MDLRIFCLQLPKDAPHTGVKPALISHIKSVHALFYQILNSAPQHCCI